MSVVVCLWVSLAGAQAQPDSAAPDSQALEFIDVINVKVVSLTVYVTDKDGKPVTGLGKDDFELFEDRNPIAVSNFYEVEAGRRSDETDEPESSQLERLLENPDHDPRLPMVSEDQRLYLVIYVDHQNLRPQSRNRVFRYVREFLRNKVSRTDRVMLVSYNRSFKVEREFTSDPTVVARALFELEKYTGGRVTVDSDRRDLLRDIDEARDQGIVSSRVRVFAEEQQNDLQFTLDALKGMVSRLAGVPGRKALLYVSDGLPMRSGEEMFVAASEKARYDSNSSNAGGDTLLQSAEMEAFHYDNSARFKDLANTANANDVAFYTVDAAGLGTRSLRTAEYQSLNFSSNIESTWANNMQTPLMFLADETGGQFAVNTNNFAGAFDRFGQDFGNYYSLGFQPTHAGNGRAYRLDVKVKGKGYKVRTRQTYRDKSIEREMEDSVLASLEFGVQKNPLRIEVKEKDRIQREDGTYVVHLDLRIPIREVTLLPRQSVHEGHMRVWVQAKDEKGGLSVPQVQTFTIPVRPEDVEDAQTKYWVYTMPLVMRPGDQQLAIGVRDDIGARESLLQETLRLNG